MRVRSITIIVVALALCSAVNGTCQGSPPPSKTLKTPLLYRNATYGFCLALPANWAGFKVLTDRWSGAAVGGESGPKLVIRNPRWTDESPHEDIPILVFTPAQRRAVYSGEFNLSAAPFGPSELGRNRKYVFGLPPRFAMYDDAIGADEVLRLLNHFQAPCSTRHPND